MYKYEVSYILVCTEFQNGECSSYSCGMSCSLKMLPLLLSLMQQSSSTYGYLGIIHTSMLAYLLMIQHFLNVWHSHNTKHLSTLHLISSRGSVCCTCFRPALIPTAHRLCFKVPKKVLGFSEREINDCAIRKQFLGLCSKRFCLSQAAQTSNVIYNSITTNLHGHILFLNYTVFAFFHRVSVNGYSLLIVK